MDVIGSTEGPILLMMFRSYVLVNPDNQARTLVFLTCVSNEHLFEYDANPCIIQ